ncbi:MAG: hypothetical protein AAF889_08835 [Cyanobacteria bacterium P01_D01_bin.73]
MGDLAAGSIPLADHDEDWVRVAASVKGMSMRAYIGNAVGGTISSEKPVLESLVRYAAQKHGLTFDEAFHRLRTKKSGDKKPLGEPLPDFPVVPEMEEKLNGLAKK